MRHRLSSEGGSTFSFRRGIVLLCAFLWAEPAGVGVPKGIPIGLQVAEHDRDLCGASTWAVAQVY
jgi:hypothetical protein